MIIEDVTEKLKAQTLCDDYGLARSALRAYQRCDYGKAIKRFTQIIVESDRLRPKLLLKRADCFFKIERFAEALKDIDCVLNAEPGNLLGLHLKGRVLFACHQFDLAREVFLELQKLLGGGPDHFGASQLIEFCEQRQRRIAAQESNSRLLEVEKEEEADRRDRETKDAVAEAMASAAAAAAPVVPAKMRHEWYQTDQAVIVSVLVKGLSRDSVKVDSSEKKLVVTVTFAGGEVRTVELDLFQSVLAKDTSYKVTPSKVEVSLKKTEAIRWDTLEAPPPAVVEEAKPAPRPAYPTSAKQQHNWDALEQEVKKQEADEKLEGDAALQKVFADIYAGASDEVKRAMNKSYMESGGTVLSTNWEEIKKDKVPVRPPDGMEFKKWE